VIEAAGPPAAQRTAFDLLRPGGVLSVISVQTEESFAFTPVEGYDANVTVAMGRASVRSLLARLLPMVAEGTVSVPSSTVVTHAHQPLESAPELYRRFADREHGMLKVVFEL
jgi:alcohol dehydrogenase